MTCRVIEKINQKKIKKAKIGITMRQIYVKYLPDRVVRLRVKSL